MDLFNISNNDDGIQFVDDVNSALNSLTTTANITDSLNKRFCTDAEKTVIDNTSGVNTGDQNLSIYALISQLASYALINIPPNIQTGDYTLQSTDNGGVVYMNSSSTHTLTIPTALTAGFNCSVIQAGSGQVTFTGSGGMVINEPDSKTKIAKQYASITVYIEATNNCIVGGYTA
jgi:hypothetical protein